MPDESKILKKIVYRFVKKYIAGQNTASALETIRKFNHDNIKTTMTLLNDHVTNPYKAKYNTNAYAHLIKQIARLHLNSDVSLRPTQIGYAINNSLFLKNLESVFDAVSSNKITLWIENEKNIGEKPVLELYKDLKQRYPKMGIEIPVLNDLKKNEIKRFVGKAPKVKLISKPYAYHAYESTGIKKKDDPLFAARMDFIKMFIGMKADLTVSAFRGKGVIKIKKALQKETKNNVKFEIPLGYSKGKLVNLANSNIPMSVYAPYGADWIQYAINNVREGRIRNIALSILNDKQVAN